MNKILKVPVRYKVVVAGVPMQKPGSGILHDTNYAKGAISRDEAARQWADDYAKSGHNRWSVEYVMEEVEPFVASLRFKKMYRSGHSSYTVWEDRKGGEWPIMLADLADLLGHVDLANGWTEVHTWEVCKRGTAYGIRMVKP
jgi:hypothetical protein